MPFEIDIPLKKFNTFGFDVKAKQALTVNNEEALVEALKEATKHKFSWQILGSGSNVVLHRDLDGLTLLMNIGGKRLIKETPTEWIIEVGAGENWHAFVQWTIDQGWAGLENLALIPGTCGAAPIQNIGAYGLEVGERIISVRTLDTSRLHESNPWVEFTQQQCQFSYRDSIFKRDPGRYIVTYIQFALPKDWQANLSYTELATYLSNLGSSQALEPRAVFDAVCAIRRSKLPDPNTLGNAGSFFHNPIVDEAKHQSLKKQFPELVSYPAPKSKGQVHYKLAAGWLIDQCGLKGYRYKHVGVYEKQALVLVHYGEGSGSELLELAQHVRQAVEEKFGVHLSQEPVILPTLES